MADIDTYFAPPGRLRNDEVYIQTIKILGLRNVLQILNVLPNMVAILNRNRQVLFANDAFIEAIGAKKFDDSLGQRPGELFACIHAQDHINGCGTGKACRHCGAVLTFLKCQETGQKQENNANITINKEGKHVPLDLHVIASPITVDNELFYLVVLTYINK
jgi:PAS domain-containing protein